MVNNIFPECLRKRIAELVNTSVGFSIESDVIRQVCEWLDDEGRSYVAFTGREFLAVPRDYFSDEVVQASHILSAATEIDDQRRLRFIKSRIAKLQRDASKGVASSWLVELPLYQSDQLNIFLIGYACVGPPRGHYVHWFGLTKSNSELKSFAKSRGFTLLDDLKGVRIDGINEYWHTK
jgi:hypothetical protein